MHQVHPGSLQDLVEETAHQAHRREAQKVVQKVVKNELFSETTGE